MEGLVPPCGITTINHNFKGRLTAIPPLSRRSTAKVKTIRDNSIRVAGSKLFNSMPSKLQNLSGCPFEVFKANLDRFLEKVPDEPKTSSLTPRAINMISGRPSNALPDMILFCRDLFKDEFGSTLDQTISST